MVVLSVPVVIEARDGLLAGRVATAVNQLDRQAATRLAGPNRIEVVEGAGHLFEEPGALETVARLAAGWFAEHVGT